MKTTFKKSTLNKDIIISEIEAIIKKVDCNIEKFGDNFPDKSKTGIYSDSLNNDGSWTGSFWTGMVLLSYVYTGDKKYIEYVTKYMPKYKNRLVHGYKDHDMGFLYQLFASSLYKVTGNMEAKDLAINAGDELMKRYNTSGKFIRAWGNLNDTYRSGKLIMDCMMNLPLLYCVSKFTGDDKYFDAAQNHANTTYQYCIRKDYSTYHTYDFDPSTGAPIGGFNEGGYSDESAWSRGQAWGIYGFVLSFEHTGDKKYLTAAENLANYYIDNLPDDLIPYWDFKMPDLTIDIKDASAATIAASGMLDIAALETDSNISKYYETAAHAILESLLSTYSTAQNLSIEGIIQKCYIREPINGPQHSFTIWGDYYYLELLMKTIGYSPKLWSV